MGLVPRHGPVLDAARDDEEFALAEDDGAVAELDVDGAAHDVEKLVFLGVMVPDELPLELDELDVLPIQLADDARLPPLGKGLERAGDVHFFHGRESTRLLSMLAPTPRDLLVDPQGRPYFLWDMEMTLEEFERAVRDARAPERLYLIGKLLRQAKPDDALQYVSPQEIADLWPDIERYLGKQRPFWTWLLDQWERLGFIRR